MILFLWACIESPLPLPPSRIITPSSGMMVQYGTLRGFLVKRGEVQKKHVWIVPQLDESHKQCALEQVAQNQQALLILPQDQIIAKKKYPSVIATSLSCH